jgi:hypothetical protein
MTATGMYLRASLRRRWRAWLSLALLIGVFAGVVTAAAAGARRTDAAYPELVRYSRSPDVLMFSFGGAGSTFANVPSAKFIALPQVTQGAALTGYTVANPADISLIAPMDRGIPEVFWHRKLLAGRLPDPGRADEVDVSFTVAQLHHVGVGGWLPLTLLGAGGPPVSVRLRVVGIDAAPSEFPPQFGPGVDTVWATPAFARLHRGQRLDTVGGAALRLRHGAASIPAVLREAHGLAGERLALAFPIATQSVNTQRSIHLQAVALWLLAALLAAVGLLIAGQLLARLAATEARAHGSLRALGMTRQQLLAAGLGRAAVIGAEAGAVAVVIAVALSPLFPVGLAGTAEPHPGVRADVPALAAGFVLTVLLVVAVAAWPVWRSTGRQDVAALRPAPGVRPVLARALAGMRPVSAAVGVRLALQRGAGRSALPVSSTLAGAGIGVAALTAALVFASSFTHLSATPRLYGTTWDASVASLSSEGHTGVQKGAAPVVARDRDVVAWSVGYSGVPFGVNGSRADALAMNPAHGQPITTPLLSGRLPQRTGEIVLGSRTLAAAHASLGQTVRVSLGNGRTAPLRVVGVAVFPALDDSLDLGKGAEVTISQLRALLPHGTPLPPADHLFVRFRPGAGAAALAGLARRLTAVGPFAVEGPTTPADVVNFGQVDNLPLVLGGCFGALALLTIAHLLVTSVRRRRRDIAVLRAVGFSRRQVRAAVAWQSGTLMAVSLAAGIPVGMICGRQIWLLLTRQLGVLPALDVPALALGVLVVAAVPLAVLIAVWPGEKAARVSPALALRAE